MNTILWIAVLSRIFVFAVAFASNIIVGVNPACSRCGDIGIPFLNLFSRWDSTYYVDIAIRGYSAEINQRWEFFPLFPIIIGILGRLFSIVPGVSLVVGVNLAGFILSNLAFIGSVYYFYRLSERALGNQKLAFDSALFLCIYPAGVFLSAVYAESLFIFLTLSSFYYWQLEAHAKTGAFSFLASLTRPVGILLVVPFAYWVLSSSRRKVLTNYVPAIASIIGYLVFAGYSQLLTGTPFADLEAEQKFWNVTTNPYAIILLARKEIMNHPIIIPFLAVTFIALAASIVQGRSRTERGFHVYSIFLLISYLVSPIISFPRYSLTILPSYWSLSRWSRRRWVKVAIYSMFLASLAIGTALFANWYSFY